MRPLARGHREAEGAGRMELRRACVCFVQARTARACRESKGEAIREYHA
jgi:hypothetical protein